jgi:ribosomal protein L11 methyltransferase
VPWRKLTLRIAASELPRVEALLELAGATSISISDAADSPLFEPEPGTTPLWPALEVQALFDSPVGQEAIDAVLGSLAGRGTGLEIVDDESVEQALRQDVHPIEIGPRLRILAADDPTPGDACTLRLHMGLAFGTGRHPTTRLCLEWIEREMPPGLTVLDFGCGSGVLALAALLVGASRATAVDTEPQAIEATRNNAALNALESRIRIGLPDIIESATCDVVLANVLAEPLIMLAPYFAARQQPGGCLVLSGILTAQVDRVEESYAHWYGSFDRHEREGWALLTGRRRSGV